LLSEIARLSRVADERAKQCALLQALIGAAPDCLWVEDIDGAFVAASMALAADGLFVQRAGAAHGSRELLKRRPAWVERSAEPAGRGAPHRARK
jgi:hypothetical protein